MDQGEEVLREVVLVGEDVKVTFFWQVMVFSPRIAMYI